MILDQHRQGRDQVKWRRGSPETVDGRLDFGWPALQNNDRSADLLWCVSHDRRLQPKGRLAGWRTGVPAITGQLKFGCRSSSGCTDLTKTGDSGGARVTSRCEETPGSLSHGLEESLIINPLTTVKASDVGNWLAARHPRTCGVRALGTSKAEHRPAAMVGQVVEDCR